ncbi:MAG: Uncharacterized protein XD69_0267 [Clostridia bacterium 62_21]|nr:MAG: Uncharacterized protein XD69_0267 [Clostridia bacterium 62_21]
MQFSFSEMFWLLFILLAVVPIVKQQRLQAQRWSLIRRIEKKRRSRVITLIHRQELISLLGIPLTRFISVEDSEHVLQAIRLTPPDMPIDLILHTPGGLVLAAEQIARALQRHPAKVTVLVPHYAMSGGTMICLAADEIVMDENAVLGPVDPQLGEYPAASIVETVRQKGKDKVGDRTLILADISGKALNQVEDFVAYLLADKMPADRARRLARALSGGQWTHDYPITAERLEALGLPVTVGLPNEVYLLMHLYPQPAQRRPSVQFIPVPYDKERDDDRR